LSKSLRLRQVGNSQHFILHPEKLKDVAELVKSVTAERYPTGQVPYHSRLRHFPKELLGPLSSSDKTIQGARYFDLVTVSVLLDAGAGPDWKFRVPKRPTSSDSSSTSDDLQSSTYTRSEGLGAASLVMFLNGLFSSSPQSDPLRVDAVRLKQLTLSELSDGLQISEQNQMLGLQGRFELLRSLGSRLSELGCLRPSDLMTQLTPSPELSIPTIWKFLFPALSPLWPKKDIHNHSTLGLVAFHKLFQWLLYSYVEVFEVHCGWSVTWKFVQTGLPEYRNGGLFIDLGVLELKQEQAEPWTVDSDQVIEWRACTVVLLDLLHQGWFSDLDLCCMLEGGTWVAGRRAAKERREDCDSPVRLILDGTVF
jgi:hypothetical protein